MKKFIIFNTKSQAENWIKRNKRTLFFYEPEGCGCCWTEGEVHIDKNKIVSVYCNQSQGYYSASARIIGKIKNCR
jgi:hypothetical protein